VDCRRRWGRCGEAGLWLRLDRRTDPVERFDALAVEGPHRNAEVGCDDLVQLTAKIAAGHDRELPLHARGLHARLAVALECRKRPDDAFPRLRPLGTDDAGIAEQSAEVAIRRGSSILRHGASLASCA